MTQISGVSVTTKEAATLMQKLETTTFEREYTKTYIDAQKKGFVGTCKKYWAIFWLHTLGHNGWKAEHITGFATLKAERVVVKEYRTQRDNMITELAKTPIINKAWANALNEDAQPATREMRAQSERVELDVLPAFYTALRGRVEFLNETTTDQAKLFRAGFMQVTAKIEAHNNNHRPTAHISRRFDIVVESEIKEKARKELASKISVDDIREKGIGALVGPLNLYIKTFGLTKEENVTTLAQEVFEEVVALHGEECQNEIDILKNDAYVVEESENLEKQLLAKLDNAQTRFEAHVEANQPKEVVKNKKAPEKGSKAYAKQAKQASMEAFKAKQALEKEGQIRIEITKILGQLGKCESTAQAKVEQEIERLKPFTPDFAAESSQVANDVVSRLDLPQTTSAFSQPNLDDSTGVEGRPVSTLERTSLRIRLNENVNSTRLGADVDNSDDEGRVDFNEQLDHIPLIDQAQVVYYNQYGNSNFLGYDSYDSMCDANKR